jgi:endogenous inhibitor of DNA gyrase (YacG/DUF329 family)
LEDVPADYPPRPFCSPRCKLVDLGNWLSEGYSISEPLGVLPGDVGQEDAVQGDEEDTCN